MEYNSLIHDIAPLKSGKLVIILGKAAGGPMSNGFNLSSEDAYQLFSACFPAMVNRLGRNTSRLIVENAINDKSDYIAPVVSDDEHQSSYFEAIKSALQMASALIAIYNFVQSRRKAAASRRDEKELIKPVRQELMLPEVISNTDINKIVQECMKMPK